MFSLCAMAIPPSSPRARAPLALLVGCRNVGTPRLIAIPVSLQAIESFALTVKEIAQMLQCFGTELAETEMPEDMNSIEHILALRTQRYCQLKVGLKAGLSTALPSLPAQGRAQHSSVPSPPWEALSPAGCSCPQLGPLCSPPGCRELHRVRLQGCCVPRSLCLVHLPWAHLRELLEMQSSV